MKNILYIIFSFSVLIACSSNAIKILPQRNIDLLKATDTMNTSRNDIAPYIRVVEDNCRASYRKEHSHYLPIKTNLIKTSNFFFEDLIASNLNISQRNVIEYLNQKLESISFLTKNSGLVSLSHAPDSNFNKIFTLPFYGNIGGTDLFTFNLENGKFVFKVIPEPINSIFWDSHPWIGQDSLCNLVLIWASDRDKPYSMTKDLNNQTIIKGNSDIFYAFRINDEWTIPAKFDTDKSINTDNYNEISPFVACAEVSPKLLFSSDRNGDFDIFSSDIAIDFSRKEIRVDAIAQPFDKGSQYDFENLFINTDANEVFPFVAFPYSDNSNELYISSDRNNLEKQKNVKGDTIVVNKGLYDIYGFNINLDCSIPPPPPQEPISIELIVTLLDSNKRNVISPVIKLVEIGNEKFELVNTSKGKFKLEPGKEYKVFGGSDLFNLDCSSSDDSTIQYYRGTKFTANSPIIKKREVKITYDSIINPILKIKYDTMYVSELVPANDPNLLKPIVSENIFKVSGKSEEKITTTENVKELRIVECAPQMPKILTETLPTLESISIPKIEFSGPFAEIRKEVIKKTEWYEGGKKIIKSKVEIFFDTIPNIDSGLVDVTGAIINSIASKYSSITTKNLNGIIKLYDTVKLEAVYYVKPPCSLVFDDINDKFYKNVPYYQTAFWKVNTSAGLKQHIQDFQKGSYLESAAYLELHPKHRKYGVAFKTDRAKRLNDYKEYSKQVDDNIDKMKDTIINQFIPALERILISQPRIKLLLKMEAYSDRRDASVCNYIGNTIHYIQGKVSETNSILLEEVNINNRATLGNNNDNLSKLRVYFGFQELIQRLKKSKVFMEYFNKGLVFLPNQIFSSDIQMKQALDKAKLIFLAEGKFYDKTIMDDEEDYDPIRRLNLIIQIIEYSSGRIITTPCCK